MDLQTFTTDQFMQLRAYWLEHGVPSEIVNPVITEVGEWNVHLDWQAFWDLPIEELRSALLKALEPVYRLQQAALDLTFETGFNDHGPIHIQQVTDKTWELLRSLHQPVDEQKIGIMAAATHDIGNIVNRKNHSHYSCSLLQIIFKDFPMSEIGERIMKAVNFHDEGSLATVGDLGEWSAAALALVIADKTDVSFKRVSSASNMKEALADIHISLNWLVDMSKTKNEGDTFVWEIYFNPRATNVPEYLDHLLKNSERKWVPDVWQELYRTHNMEYVLAFYAMLLSTYLDRIEMTVEAVFALFADMHTFRLDVVDEERSTTISRVFTREKLQQQLQQIKRMVHKHD